MGSIERYPVVVAGLGPVGALAGNLLGRMGINVLILEKFQEINREPRAVHLDDISMRIFRLADLSEEVERITVPLKKYGFLDAQNRPLWEIFAPDYTENGFSRSSMFYQPELEEILHRGLKRYSGIQVQTGAEIQNIESVEDALYRVEYRDLESGDRKTVISPYVLGCDGARSLTRKHMGSGLRDLEFHQSWLVVDLLIKSKTETPKAVLQYCDPKRPTSYVLSSGNRRRFEFMIQEGESKEEIDRPETIEKLIRARMHLPETQIIRSAIYRFHSLIANQWRKGGMFLLGDAAHQTPPFLGQGLNQGIRDVMDLTWKLRMVLENRAGSELLETYQSEQEPRTENLIRLTMLLGSLIQSSNSTRAFFTRFFFRLLSSLPFLGKILEKNMGRLPPLGPGFFQADPNGLTGESFPSGRVLDAEGREIEIDEILENEFAILSVSPADLKIDTDAELRFLKENLKARVFLLSGVSMSVADHSILYDTEGSLLDWFKEKGVKTVLLRPDRYVFGTGPLTNLILTAKKFLGDRSFTLQQNESQA